MSRTPRKREVKTARAEEGSHAVADATLAGSVHEGVEVCVRERERVRVCFHQIHHRTSLTLCHREASILTRSVLWKNHQTDRSEGS